MDIIPLRPGFGAELRGVTLADVAAHDAAFQAVRAAFEEYSVLVFRNQEVTNESQLAFSRRFGPPEITKVGSLGTGTHFVVLTTIGPDGKVVPADHRYAMRNKANQLWHTDSSFKSVPALASILSARVIPDNGGETEFASTRLAFERLDPALRDKFENSFAWHHYGHSRKKIAEGLATTEELAALPPQCWRMVWRNPANGRVSWSAPPSRRPPWTVWSLCAHRRGLRRSRPRSFCRYGLGAVDGVPLHFAADANRLVRWFERDIGRGQNLAGGNVARQLDMMR
jgi:alpha-ketoglutarate-dependent 2,4-dichlorophenoxyacetate dioxygenase